MAAVAASGLNGRLRQHAEVLFSGSPDIWGDFDLFDNPQGCFQRECAMCNMSDRDLIDRYDEGIDRFYDVVEMVVVAGPKHSRRRDVATPATATCVGWT